MKRGQFEIVEVGNTQLTVDVSNINNSNMYFNATEQARAYGKRPDDFWKQKQNKEYLDALITLNGGNKDFYIITRRGRKYGGTWLHNDLDLAFARWLSPLFAVSLGRYIKQRLSEERTRQQTRLAARTGYLPMSKAVKGAHDPAEFYHFSTEANMLNVIVLGVSSKQFKAIHNVDNVRDALSSTQIKWIDKLQRINTGLIEVGMPYKVRKAMLTDCYNDTLRLAA